MDYFNVQRALSKVGKKFDLTIIHGGAKGVDHWAHVYCELTRTPEVVFMAKWEKYGNAAGHMRNQQMIDEGMPELLLSFPGGAGTRDMTNRCLAARIPVKLIGAREQDDCPQGIEKPAAQSAARSVQHVEADIACAFAGD